MLVGSSSGGGLALDFTLTYPEKVSSSVLVSALIPGFDYSDHFLHRGGQGVKEAIDIFRLNAGVHRDSAKAHEALGDAYAAYDEKEMAIRYYKRSLEINSNNPEAEEKLVYLEDQP